MPKIATVLNLVPAEDTDTQAIASRLGVGVCVIVPGNEVRSRGAREGLAYLRKTIRESHSDTFAIHSLNWSRQSQRTSLYALACMAPSSRRFAIDTTGAPIPLTWADFVLREVPYSIRQSIAGRNLVAKTLATASKSIAAKPSIHRPKGIQNIVYMRTDLWFGVKAGGSIGHVAGVVNGFLELGKSVQVMSWERPPLVNEAARFVKVEPGRLFINDRELALLDYNNWLVARKLEGPVDAIYARYSLDCWAPAAIAKSLNVPLILEFNGSEVWIEENWGRGLKYPKVAQAIEGWLLKSADLIVVVSSQLRDWLMSRGVESERILVNPNAVDPEKFDPGRYSPDEINKLKSQLGIAPDRIIAGFIGTFSPWHGVEVLADAIPLALKECPRLHFLLIGSGPLYDSVKEKLSRVADRVTLTGLIPQDQASTYLLCSDFFLSPHVPNADGTPFFGSPTKLFEYMCLGKGIIASNLDQLGEILQDRKTALLVPPGDSSALARAIEELCENRGLSETLGKAARAEALEKHTWKGHVERILSAL